MTFTAYMSDVHNNLEILSAYRVVHNHLAKLDKGAVVISGDFASQESTEAFMQKAASADLAKEVKSKEYEAMHEELAKINGGKYACMGNHDIGEIVGAMPELKFIDQKDEVIDINDRKHFSVYHSSMNFMNEAENGYVTVKSRKNLEERLGKADVLVTHEGVTDDLTHKAGNYSNEFGAAAKKRGKKLMHVCGHEHKDTYIEQDGLIGFRPYSMELKGATYFVVHEGKKDTIYRLSNDKLIEWAEQLAPNEVKKVQKKEIPIMKTPDGKEYVPIQYKPETKKHLEELGLQPKLLSHNGQQYLGLTKEEFEVFKENMAQAA